MSEREIKLKIITVCGRCQKIERNEYIISGDEAKQCKSTFAKLNQPYRPSVLVRGIQRDIDEFNREVVPRCIDCLFCERDVPISRWWCELGIMIDSSCIREENDCEIFKNARKDEPIDIYEEGDK